ncbi:MAG: universal stress protein [Roseococcus sp.]|nr:universal stress protein [Roseococcus sp.]
MTITTILCQVEPGSGAAFEASLKTPIVLAEAYGAHLTALIFPIETEEAGATVPGADAATAEEDAAALLRAAAERSGVSCEVRSRSSFAYGVGDVFADHLRVSDLGVLTLRAARGMGQRLLLGAAIFESGRPLLVVRQDQPLMASPSRVVIAWDATPACVRAVHAALPFIRRAEETLIVTVTNDKEFRAGQSGIELARLLARHGANSRFAAVGRGAEGVLEAVIGAAGEAKADMLVMGAVRHAPLRNIVFGSATQDLLDRGPQLATLIAA